MRYPEQAPQTGEKTAAAMRTLEAGIKQVLTSEGFANYLRAQARFTDYSPNNVILIATQKPDATRVAGYKAWQELGRQVKKGEKGIQIFVPFKRKELDEDTGEEQLKVTGFGIGYVFDVSQTDGDPLPEPPSAIPRTDVTQASREVNLRLSRWLRDDGVRLESIVFHGHQKGSYYPNETPKRIAIRKSEAVDPLSVGKTKTLVHEAAHYVADHKAHDDRTDAETVAESAAFVVMDHYGMPTGDYSFGYVAAWAKEQTVFVRNTQAIQKVSHTLIDAIEKGGEPAQTQ